MPNYCTNHSLRGFHSIEHQAQYHQGMDQNSRKELLNLRRKKPEKTKALTLQMKKTDKENQQFVAGLLDNCGWPKGPSAENNHTIFLGIDHGETDYENKYLPLVKQQAELGICA